MYSIEEFDKQKSKVLKYVLYKKRTEQEVRKKFENEIEENLFNDIIDVLKENSYIDDYNYIERAMNEYKNIKNLSIKEVKYKLLSKGISSKKIDNYISDNSDFLEQYELESARELIRKKRKTLEDDNIRAYLIRKGYNERTLKEAFED